MREDPRSRCPINLTLELLGDRWSLLILRDMIFGGRRHFRELLNGPERIASNMLAERLKMLLAEGMLTRRDDPSHKQKAIYSLTEKSISLVPILAEVGAWGSRWLPVSEELSVRAKILAAGGPPMWEQFMAELRAEHLGTPLPDTAASGPTVRQNLQAAYEKTVKQVP